MTTYVQYSTSPVSYANGLVITNDATTPNTVFNISEGSCSDSTNQFQMVASEPINVSSAINGANGLDTGTVAASTIYAIYLITDPFTGNPTAAVMSTSIVAPVMPFGYSIYKRIGYIRTDGSSNFQKGYWAGQGTWRQFFYDTAVSTGITTGNSTTFVTVSAGAGVPAVEGYVAYMFMLATPSAAGRVCYVRPFGSAANYFPVIGQVATVQVAGLAPVPMVLNAGVPSFQYSWSSGGGDSVAILINGYEYGI